LQDRWTCRTSGHTYCFANHDGAHVPVNEDAMESWVSALVRTRRLCNQALHLSFSAAQWRSDTADSPEKPLLIELLCFVRHSFCHINDIQSEYYTISASVSSSGQSQSH
jgi:hypothetical protein